MSAEWTDREKRLHDALKLAMDYIGDGSPDDTYAYVMAQCRAATQDVYVVSPADFAAIAGAIAAPHEPNPKLRKLLRGEP